MIAVFGLQQCEMESPRAAHAENEEEEKKCLEQKNKTMQTEK